MWNWYKRKYKLVPEVRLDPPAEPIEYRIDGATIAFKLEGEHGVFHVKPRLLDKTGRTLVYFDSRQLVAGDTYLLTGLDVMTKVWFR